MPFSADLNTSRTLVLAAGGASALLLVAALVFQAAGYVPCELCILQRWPHVAAAGIAAAVLLTGYRPFWSVLGMIAAAVATGLAVYHSGVELKWWAGPVACSGGGLGDLAAISAADLVDRIRSSQVVRCDQPALLIFGLSMAAWNALASAALTVVWVLSLRRARN